ncbi:MAG: trypsin-like peptidase domain-containing protein [Aeromicrobium sp.]
MTRRKLATLVTLVMLAMTISSTASADDSNEHLRALISPSLAYVHIGWSSKVYDNNNHRFVGHDNVTAIFELSYRCTGFVVNSDGYVATAGHCLDPNEVTDNFKKTAARWAIDHHYYKDDVSVSDAAADYSIGGEKGKEKAPGISVDLRLSLPLGTTDRGPKFDAKVLASQTSDEGDAGLLKIEQKDLVALRLSATGHPTVTAPIVAFGFPGSVGPIDLIDQTPSFETGSVISKKHVGKGGRISTYGVSAGLSGGMSGGPSVDPKSGAVVGFNSFGARNESNSFDFIRPVSLIADLLAGKGVEAKSGTVSQDYKAGIDAYFAGNKNLAVAKLQAVVDEQPGNAYAQQYLAKAKVMPKAKPAPKPKPASDGKSFPTGLVVGGVVVLAIIGLGVAVVVRARNRQGL